MPSAAPQTAFDPLKGPPMAKIIKAVLDEVHGLRAQRWRIPPGFYCAAVIEDGNGGQRLSMLDIPKTERSIAAMAAWCERRSGTEISSWRICAFE
jgi:hypothetical protein